MNIHKASTKPCPSSFDMHNHAPIKSQRQSPWCLYPIILDKVNTDGCTGPHQPACFWSFHMLGSQAQPYQGHATWHGPAHWSLPPCSNHTAKGHLPDNPAWQVPAAAPAYQGKPTGSAGSRCHLRMRPTSTSSHLTRLASLRPLVNFRAAFEARGCRSPRVATRFSLSPASHLHSAVGLACMLLGPACREVSASPW